MKMSRAAAKKILKEREKRGGSGGGSLRPMRTGAALSVMPEDGDGSVALIVRPGSRRIVLAVLVLVELRLEVRDIEANHDGLVAVGRRGHLGLTGLLVPDLEDV